MIDFMTILLLIAKHVRQRIGDKSLNELIAQGVAVYLEIFEAMPKSRIINHAIADPDIVNDVIEELAALER